MNYADFLTLVKENTNKLDDYKGLCRFCLDNQPNVFDMGDDNCNSMQRRGDIFNNYIIITKEYVRTTVTLLLRT